MEIKKPSDTSYYRRLSKTSSTNFNRLINAEGSHTVRVNACNAAGDCGSYKTITIKADISSPSKPASITATLQNDNSEIYVKWSRSADAASYKFEVNVHGDRLYRVKACNTGGCSSYVTTSTAISTQDKPNIPLPFHAELINEGHKIWVHWAEPSDASSVELEAQVNNDGWEPQTITGTERIYTVQDFSRHGTRSYRLRACNGDFCSTYILANTTLDTLPIPDAPNSLSLSQYTLEIGQSVLVSWKPADNAQMLTYNLDVKKPWDDTYYRRLTNTTAEQFSRYIGASGTHLFKVNACNSFGVCGEYAHQSLNATSDAQSCDWSDQPQPKQANITVSQPIDFSWNKSQYSECSFSSPASYNHTLLVSQICENAEYQRELIRFYQKGTLATQWNCTVRDSKQQLQFETQLTVSPIVAPEDLRVQSEVE